jgi:hypothetical protein
VLARGLLAEQPPAKPLHLRDLLVARGAFVFGHDTPPARRTAYVRALGPGALVFGWGRDERGFVADVSRGGGAVVPSDWALNLSALGHLRAEMPARPRPARPAPAQPGERVVAFVMSDGDNVQWLLNSFTEEGRGWWASPRRGRIPMTWEFAPLLEEFAPRVMAWFYRRAVVNADDFVAGPSGHGYWFPSLAGREAPALARRTARAAGRAQLPLVTLLNAGGSMEDARPFLEQPEVHGVLYKDYAPYHREQGRLLWHRGKPAAACRFLLWEGMPDATPEAVAAAVAALPADPARDPDSYALVNVHAWSWRALGGPMEAVHRTVERLPAGTRVVTATEFFALLNQNRAALGGAAGE